MVRDHDRLRVALWCRGRNKDTVEKVVAKAQDKKFFLGLDRAWLGQ